MPASDRRLEEIGSALKKDDTLRVVMHYVHDGWPDKKTTKSLVKTYFNEQGNLAVRDGLFLNGKRPHHTTPKLTAKSNALFRQSRIS